ncbi:GGDEF domain-containing protein [Actinoplanes sp. RD1]|uniref:GGDEF domain-containing protein n=1 Tax=Actinoplanes sp. RD1 TaxID=3064538 RepID=UPI002741B12E|nr:GGDEF domain-containing protein [Actinoplanes sp. RD1]
MTSERLPVVVQPHGPWAGLALEVHDLTIQGRHAETLAGADRAEWTATLLGDLRTVRSIRLARMYALTALGRLQEALSVGERLVADSSMCGPRATDAKILADTAEVLIRMGRTDDGLLHLARALLVLDTVPTGSVRRLSAMSSLCEAARAAELFELADECLRGPVDALDFSDIYRSSFDLQRAELLLEWGLRLEQVGRSAEAARLYATSVALLEHWTDRLPGAPLAAALLAAGLAKTGRPDEATKIVGDLLVPLRAAGQHHEARLLHLAHALVLRADGDLRGARRELVAADELAVQPSQRLLFKYELASLAAAQLPDEAAQPLLAALDAHAQVLWQLRLDRRKMLQQAYRRVELEAARTRADHAATSDPLTGLGNRRLFDRRLAVPAGALLLIDVDRFKSINDDFSHSVGDRVLAEIAAVLRTHCRRDDDVAIRFGGDEFAMFLTATAPDARRIAERVRAVLLTRDWTAIAPGLRVTVSMGLATGRPGEPGHLLYDRADAQLYAAKRAGRNRLSAA